MSLAQQDLANKYSILLFLLNSPLVPPLLEIEGDDHPIPLLFVPLLLVREEVKTRVMSLGVGMGFKLIKRHNRKKFFKKIKKTWNHNLTEKVK